MEVLLLAIISLSNIACFVIGARIGQKVAKDEKIELPKVDVMQAYRDKKAKQAEEMEQNRIDTILRNIDNYDGTANGQEEVR